jgi:hypothetical protein
MSFFASSDYSFITEALRPPPDSPPNSVQRNVPPENGWHKPFKPSKAAVQKRPEQRLLLGKISVDLGNQLFAVCPVNGAGVLDAFSAGSGAAKAMHAHLKKERRGALVKIENIANQHIFCNFGHCYFLLDIYSTETSGSSAHARLPDSGLLQNFRRGHARHGVQPPAAAGSDTTEAMIIAQKYNRMLFFRRNAFSV